MDVMKEFEKIAQQAADEAARVTGIYPKRPDSPTLAEIKADARTLSIWSIVRSWAIQAEGPNGTDEGAQRAAIALDRAIAYRIDAAYEAGRRDAHDVEHAADMKAADAIIAQQISEISRMKDELSGARAEIARLRANKPDPAPKPIASPSIGARWVERPGMLKEF